MIRVRSRTWLVVGLLGTGLSLSGCSFGGGGGDEEALEKAREEGAAQARLDERARQQNQTNRRLEREIERLKRGNGSSGGSSSSGSSSGASSSGTSTSASSSGQGLGKSCGSGVMVSSATSCDFAGSVVSTYYSEGEPGSLQAYSSVTDRTYTTSCSGASPVTCSGGNGAVVRFP